MSAIVSFAPLARAAEPESDAEAAAADEARRADARARYEAGVEKYKQGRFKDAVDLFLEADRLVPSAPLSYNIARSYEKLGDGAAALRWYRDYLRRAPEAANRADVEKLVRALEAELATKGVQQITVRSEPAGATVTVGGRPRGVTPWTGELAPGRHDVLLTLRGYSDHQQTVELPPDRAQDLFVRLVPGSTTPKLPAAPAATAPGGSTPGPKAPDGAADTPRADTARFGIVPWVVLGAGAATLGGAFTFELLRRSAESDAEKERTQIDFAEKLDTVESRQTTARVLLAVGGGLVVVGGALLAVELGTRKGGGQASLSGGCAPGRCELVARGSF